MKYTFNLIVKTVLALLVMVTFVASATDNKLAESVLRVNETIAAGPSKPNWESLKSHHDPEWFRDAKFGIYTHWGPISVVTEKAPTFMEWYGHQCYLTNDPAFAYHRQKFGDQKTVGYKDVIPHFKAEKFNADEWAALFARAGAKFAGPVAIHHDNYANWDSALTRWNSQAIGPHRDLTGELEKAIRQHGMKFITTFHHGFAWRYYEPAYQFDAADSQWADLYGEPHGPNDGPNQRFLDTWLGLVDEVLVKYHPDLIWFDFELGSVIPPAYQQRMFACTYDWASQNGREIGVAHKHPEIHQYTGILDIERGREDHLTSYPWLTDTSVGPWFHHNIATFKTVPQLVGELVDIVSKNGCMLLNVGPKADGTIPDKAKALLLGIGDWLHINGEAIYGTRPWLVFGEGPKQTKGGSFGEDNDQSGYTAEDLRFTRSKDGRTLYVLALGWPEHEFTVNSMKVDAVGSDARVELLGYGKVEFSVNSNKQLVIKPPVQRTGEHAFAFRLTGFEISLHLAGRFNQPGALQLEPDKATCEGKQVRLQVNEGRPNLGCWDSASDRVHWLVNITQPGSYVVRGEFSSAYGASGLKLSIAEQRLSANVPTTDGWFKPVFTTFGRFTFARPGVYHVILESADPAHWRAVNVYQLQLAHLQ